MKKNKRVIILLSVLILGIGISLAYFVGKTIFTGNGATTEGRTATVNGSTLDVKGILEFDDPDIYPGHQSLSEIEVTATGDNEFIAYNLTWEGNNGLNTNLKYYVYKSEKDNQKIILACEKKKKVKEGVQYLNEECKSNIEEELGSPIKEGEIPTTEEGTTKEIITDTEYISANKDGEKVYYYVIVEYPNLTSEDLKKQNEDIGHNFDGKVYAEISNKSADINILGIYIKDEETGEYKEAKTMPDNNYIINSEESECSNGATASTNLTNNTVNISSLSLKGTSCYLYYEKYNAYSARDTLLNNLSDKNTTLTSIRGIDETETFGKIYQVADDDGISYVFRGKPIDNYMIFGKNSQNEYIWWRIIRINGNGTIRLIYMGTSSDNKEAPTKESVAFRSQYSENSKDQTYVGFIAGTPGATSYVNAHNNSNKANSIIYQSLKNWYISSNLITYESFIDIDTGFCNDREVTSGFGYGNLTTTYAPLGRLYNGNWLEEENPTLKCNNQSRDLFTKINSSRGNRELEMPVGLITSDEAVYAGGNGNSSSNFWLNINTNYWTMSPQNYTNSYATVFYIHSTGSFKSGNGGTLASTLGVRPVINLKSNVKISGSGLINDPYYITE